MTFYRSLPLISPMHALAGIAKISKNKNHTATYLLSRCWSASHRRCLSCTINPLSFLTSKRFYSHETWSSSIFAVSSGHGKCGVSVIRVSGPHAHNALKTLGRFNRNPCPRRAYVKKIYHPLTNELLDRAILLWFPGNVIVQQPEQHLVERQMAKWY